MVFFLEAPFSTTPNSRNGFSPARHPCKITSLRENCNRIISFCQRKFRPFFAKNAFSARRNDRSRTNRARNPHHGSSHATASSDAQTAKRRCVNALEGRDPVFNSREFRNHTIRTYKTTCNKISIHSNDGFEADLRQSAGGTNALKGKRGLPSYRREYENE